MHEAHNDDNVPNEFICPMYSTVKPMGKYGHICPAYDVDVKFDDVLVFCSGRPTGNMIATPT